MTKVAIALLGILVLGCSSTKEPGAVSLPKEYSTFQGLRVAAPDLLDGDERLDIFLGTPKEPEDDLDKRSMYGQEPEFVDIVYCIALNKEKGPLSEVFGLINAGPPNKVIYIYGEVADKKYQFWVDGLDCIAKAIGVWHPKARRYMYFDLSYDTPTWRYILNKQHLRRLVEEGVDIVK